MRFSLLLCILFSSFQLSSETICPGNKKLFHGPQFILNVQPLKTARFIQTNPCGKITHVSNERPAPSKNLQEIKLPGSYAFAGFHDAHAHLRGMGWMSEVIDLKGLTSIDAIRKRISDYIETHPDYDYYEGRGWDQNLFEDKEYPTAEDLNGLSDKFIALRRVDGHATWINRPLMNHSDKQCYGCLSSTQGFNIPGGEIMRDDKGNAAGVFTDMATDVIKLPKPSDDVRRRQIWKGMEMAAAAGLTSVHDMGFDWKDWRWLLSKSMHTPVRVFAYMDDVQDKLDTLEPVEYFPLPMSRVRQMGVKLYADGALGSRGAKLCKPYSDAPESSGSWVTPPDVLKQKIKQIDDAGLQVAVHAIGPCAIDEVISLLPAGKRHRLEHYQIAKPKSDKRAAKKEITISMQPTHGISDFAWVPDRLGRKRAQWGYRWNAVKESGALLVSGTDAPVESISPIGTILASMSGYVNHLKGLLSCKDYSKESYARLWDHANNKANMMYTCLNGDPLKKSQSYLDFLSVFDSMTASPAKAVFLEKELGKLEVGHHLDLTLLDEANIPDIYQPPEFGERLFFQYTQVAGTVIGGKLIQTGEAK